MAQGQAKQALPPAPPGSLAISPLLIKRSGDMKPPLQALPNKIRKTLCRGEFPFQIHRPAYL